MVPQVPAAQFVQWQRAKAGAKPVVLDVREPWEVETACVQADGFELKIIAMGEITVRLGELTQDRPIACLCHHGMRSMQVARYLQQQGFTDVVNLAGGIEAWSTEIDPSVPRY
jgi:rhodanese-related sulfurtransferase